MRFSFHIHILIERFDMKFYAYFRLLHDTYILNYTLVQISSASVPPVNRTRKQIRRSLCGRIWRSLENHSHKRIFQTKSSNET